jgi:Na+-transporting NADH:ubiquinone oxidoreductase subunit C
VSEPQANKSPSSFQTIVFMIVLSFVCALILSVLASALEEPKEIAKELYRSKQMMIAAKILSPHGYFLMKNAQGEFVPAKLESGLLVAGNPNDIATRSQLLEVYEKRLIPRVVNDKGDLLTFEEASLDKDDYIAEFKKTGYYKEPFKLIYIIYAPSNEYNTASENKEKIDGYVIPINGFGLWDAIYGYLAIAPDGDDVIGITWYEQKETPGLGANISEDEWQKQFYGKNIFQPSPDGNTNFRTAPLGIVVVKGKVAEVLGDSPKAQSAVDGMAGATLTGNGVTDAYKDVLAAYRPFLIRIHEDDEKNKDKP